METSRKGRNPIQTSYILEIDSSTELEPIEAAYYQSFIGILQWMVDIGRLDIFLK